MSFSIYTPLRNLNSSKVKWTIRVKAQAIWRGITRETKEFRGLNVLFFDDYNTRIHVFINAKFAALFEDNLEEGQIYKIENFYVQRYTGLESHRCVRNEQHIYFGDYTKLEKLTNGLPIFAGYAFDFFDVSDIHRMESNSRFLCDVIGILKHKEAKREYVNENKEDKTQLKFSITDGRCTAKVTFFGEIAHSFHDALLKESGESTIIVIASAKLGTYLGELNLTNFPATRVYLNPEHYAVKHLRRRASEPSFYEKKTTLEESLNVPMMNLNEITKLDDRYDQDKVRCEVSMNKIDKTKPWYYNVCSNCTEELIESEGRFKCHKCMRYIPYPDKRFRICSLCSDSTGVIAIVLEDAEVRRLTGTTFFALQLQGSEEEDGMKFPDTFEQLAGKQYTVTLKISKTKLGRECNVYEAVEIVEGFEQQLRLNTPSELSGESADSFDDKVRDGFNACSTNPSTSSSKSPSKVRKNNNEEHADDDENVPLYKMMKHSKR